MYALSSVVPHDICFWNGPSMWNFSSDKSSFFVVIMKTWFFLKIISVVSDTFSSMSSSKQVAFAKTTSASAHS